MQQSSRGSQDSSNTPRNVCIGLALVTCLLVGGTVKGFLYFSFFFLLLLSLMMETLWEVAGAKVRVGGTVKAFFCPPF